MTDDQKLARGLLQLYRWNSLQNNFFQNNLGLLSADTWEQSLILLRLENLNVIFVISCLLMLKAFGAFLESLPDECAD